MTASPRSAIAPNSRHPIWCGVASLPRTPNVLWMADMTDVPIWASFIFLAVVVDAWSRCAVGWAIGERMTAELVLAALNMHSNSGARLP
jgi:transposase InsO family protein